MSDTKEGRIMQDNIETFNNGSVFQHGNLNNRIYLMKLVKDDFPDILYYFKDLAAKNSYTKLFCKVPAWASPEFISNGFHIEAYIPKFYNSVEDVFFMAKYLNSDRLLGIENEKLTELGNILTQKNQSTNKKQGLDKNFTLRELLSRDAEAISNVYRIVFKSYPFPIHEASYIIKTMKLGVRYFGIESINNQLIACSSAEVDQKGSNAEMTDFATLPEYRGKKFSIILLNEMENALKKQGITCFYTIARLYSIPMNKTFLNSGYTYAGTLLNNTNIAGKIESMNVLYKNIK